MAREQVVQAGQHDVVGFFFGAQVSAQGRTGPADGPGLGQQRVLERGEIAEAHELGAPLDRLGHGLVRQARQQAGQAVAAARDQGHIGTTGRRAGDGGQAGVVVTGKAHVAGQGRGIDLDLVAQRLQARNATLEGGLVAHRAGGRENIDVPRAVVVAARGGIVVVLV